MTMIFGREFPKSWSTSPSFKPCSAQVVCASEISSSLNRIVSIGIPSEMNYANGFCSTSGLGCVSSSEPNPVMQAMCSPLLQFQMFSTFASRKSSFFRPQHLRPLRCSDPAALGCLQGSSVLVPLQEHLHGCRRAAERCVVVGHWSFRRSKRLQHEIYR